MAKVILDNTNNSWTDPLGENDIVYGEGGNDTLYGGNGADILYGGDNRDYLYGQAGNDTLYGDGATDYVYGGEGNDVLYAGEAGFWDWLYGGAGNDTLFGKTSFGGAGAGYGDVSGGVTVDLRITGAQNTGAGGVDTLKDISSLSGSSFNDHLVGNGNGNSLYGQGGNDTLDGGGGDDWLRGGAGDDILIGGAGDDNISGGSGINTINGGLGIDTVDYTDATSGVTIDLNLTSQQNNGQGGFDILSGIEQIDGSYNYGDLLIGDAQDNKLYGAAGNDTLLGGAGDDWLLADDDSGGPVCDDYLDGGEGNDWLGGGGGEDTLLGGAGNDIINAGLYASSIVDGGDGRDAASFIWNHGVRVDLRITEAQDTGSNIVTLLNIEDIEGSGRIDGHDILIGNSGNNGLWGVQGNDWLTGGLGADTLHGGNGEDCFVYEKKTESTLATTDTVQDFATGDNIVFSGMAGISVLPTAYSWKGSVANTVSAIRGDAALSNVVAFFTNGTDGWLAIKGKGRGQDFDNTVIELTGRKIPLRAEDIITHLPVEDTEAPIVERFTSTSNSGTYREGEVINITAQMSEVVKAGSNFTVTLDTGDVITLTTDADSKTLTGKYIVSAGDHSADLRITSFTAGSVHDHPAGNAMTDTTLPEGNNLGDKRNIIVETGGIPTLTGYSIVSDPGADDTYGVGDIIRVAATFNEAVNVIETPSVKLNVGDNKIRLAKFASGSGTNTLTFEYKVQATDADNDGVSIGTNALALGIGGAIRDSADNNAVLANLVVLDNPGHKVAGQIKVSVSDAGSSGIFTVKLTDPAGNAVNAPVDITLTYGLRIDHGLSKSEQKKITIPQGEQVGTFAIDAAWASKLQMVTLLDITSVQGVNIDTSKSIGWYQPSVEKPGEPKVTNSDINANNDTITLTFDKEVSPATNIAGGEIRIYNLTADPNKIERKLQMSSLGQDTVTASGETVTITLAVPLKSGCEFEVCFSSNVLEGLSGIGVRQAKFSTGAFNKIIDEKILSSLPVKVDVLPVNETIDATKPQVAGPASQGYNTKLSHGYDSSKEFGSPRYEAKFAIDFAEPDSKQDTNEFKYNYRPILAVAAGTVVYAGDTTPESHDKKTYGNVVTIMHEDDNGKKYYTSYMHLSEIKVGKSEAVTAGQVIGVEGNTWGQTNIHLHFQSGSYFPDGKYIYGTKADNATLAAPIYFQPFIANDKEDLYEDDSIKDDDDVPDSLKWDNRVRSTDIIGTNATGTGTAIERLFGSNGRERIFGLGGDDCLRGDPEQYDTKDNPIGGDADELYGGRGNDTLWGWGGDDLLRGGSGVDALYGGPGNDEMYGGTEGDLLEGSVGNDTLYGDDGVDTLKGGDQNDVLFGGKDRDYLYGDAGEDVLNGGEGGDFLSGGTGKDIFVFDKPINSMEADTIMDFMSTKNYDGKTTWETINLDQAIFGKLAVGSVSRDNFCLNNPEDNNDYLIYNTTTGALFYDADGIGTTCKPVQFAMLDNRPSDVTEKNFIVFIS